MPVIAVPGTVPRRRLIAAATALTAAAVGVSVVGPAGTAHAASPDNFGYVLYNGTGTSSTGTTPAATTVTVIGTGRYRVLFPGQANPGGTAHVTAISSAPVWCQLNSFQPAGPDEAVFISCYKVGGGPTPTPFSAIFDASSAPASAIGAFGYVYSQPTGAIINQFNSAGFGNTVTHLTTGVWKVQFPGLSTPGPIDGGLQATAVSQQIPARCKIANWTSGSLQTANVNCYDAGGNALDTQFTLSYQYRTSLYSASAPPKYFGYLWNVPPIGPASTNWNNPLGGPANSISGGSGLWLAKFPQLGSPNVLPDNIQVTAAGGSSEFCNLQSIWTHSGTDTIVRNVACYDNSGTAANVGSLVSDNDLQ